MSAGLDYPGVGPEHAYLKDSGRASYVSITDDEALAAFHALCRIEGILPALESSHALAYAAKLAPTLPKDKLLLVNLSGRGDKDMDTVAQRSGLGARRAPSMNRIDATFAKLAAAGRTALIPYVTAGDPSLELTSAIIDALVDAGADVDRARRAVLGSDGGRAGHPARFRARARTRRLADERARARAALPRAECGDADRADGLREPGRGDGHSSASPTRRATRASTAC